jgi:hypothetical protein
MHLFGVGGNCRSLHGTPHGEPGQAGQVGFAPNDKEAGGCFQQELDWGIPGLKSETWGTLRFHPSILQRAQALSVLSRLASASRLLPRRAGASGMTKGRVAGRSAVSPRVRDRRL